MDKKLRDQFNRSFTQEKYDTYMQKIEALHPGALDFRNAETPVFVPRAFKEKMLSACDEIIEVITDPHFMELTQNSIPKDMNVPGEDAHTQFLVFDFGVCQNAAGELEPQLIEMQGFPTLFGFQVYHSQLTAEYAALPASYSPYLNGYNKESYTQLLKEIIVGNLNAENVILLEIFPEQQKTRIDFYCTETLLGIKTVCLTKVKADGKNLYYENAGKKTAIKRIYNRVIFDDLQKQENLPPIIDLSKEYDVEWAPHPNWFNRISKFTLPFIQHQCVPETYFLNEIKQAVNLNEFVLKPLFSFAGMGVVIDVQQSDIDAIKDPENWILQKKVNYAPVIETPNEPAKAEIRLFYFWKNEWQKPVGVLNLARLSKGKMIGTRYNKDKDWVGGSVAFFEM
ncbi:MAG: hypothetical protein IPO46_03445 [Chitinophagaceae bacterium]|jgi:hypothetical protein|nr:hypothetical protein [Chitinophagaceae bacterium]MBP6046905.1 hypothetical protein [Ferruginibacter sp.]MBK7347217.1 hypothetical protein [Chitinophagaceae bacterium]MBK8928988.1 hypothetical protein [Chitinophagaceae bacterium]MBK9957761.1 hypothetical protein [Chitinophagaceae bacterium]